MATPAPSLEVFSPPVEAYLVTQKLLETMNGSLVMLFGVLWRAWQSPLFVCHTACGSVWSESRVSRNRHWATSAVDGNALWVPPVVDVAACGGS